MEPPHSFEAILQHKNLALPTQSQSRQTIEPLQKNRSFFSKTIFSRDQGGDELKPKKEFMKPSL